MSRIVVGQPLVAFGVAVKVRQRVLDDHVHLVRGERRADARLASLLSAGLTLLAFAILERPLGLGDIAGRRLGRVARVLLQACDFVE